MASADTGNVGIVVSGSDVSTVFSRTFPADRTAPREAAAWVRIQPLGLSESRLSDIELCVDELVTNVVRYAWADDALHSVTLRIERTPSELEISLEDDGRPFDPRDAQIARAPRSLAEAAPGGRGLMLVRSIAAQIRYERRDGRNRVTLVFPLD